MESNTFSANKIWSHLDRVMSSHLPITADIFLNNYCNNDCTYCVYKRWELDHDARSMAFDDFVRYAKRLRELGVLGFILTGGGEPTISKDFDRITAWLDEQDIKYGINTNFNRYVECKPEYLKVSLDAWDSRSYRQIRGVDAYKTVRENIIRYAATKSDRTSLGIQMIAKDRQDVNLFYEANKDLPVDYIVIRPIESTNGFYYKELPKTERCQPNAITEEIRKIMDTDHRVKMNFKWDLIGKRFSECIGEWSQIAVNELGQVMYCCHKPYQIIGHVMDEDILEKKALTITDMSMCDIPCRLSSVNHSIEVLFQERKNAEFI